MLLNRCQENLSIKQKVAYKVVGACRVMKKFVVFCVIALVLNSFTNCNLKLLC